MMQQNHFQLSILFIIFCSLFIIVGGCDSYNDVYPEPMESEEIVEPEPEEIADNEQEEAELDLEPEIKAVVNVEVLRLRSGPGTDYEIIDRLIKGSILKVVGEQDEWLQVMFFYKEGWVHGDYVVKPENPERLYEVLSVKVQPIGYTKEEVAKFVEEFTSFGCLDLVLPEFNNPNEISDSDLIWAIKESKYEVIPKYYSGFGSSYGVSFNDVQEAARAIFGSDLKDIELYNDRAVLGVERVSGCGQSTETRVIDIVEKEKEFHVDVVHLIYYHSPYGIDFHYLASEKSRYDDFDNEEAFIDNNLYLGDHITEEIIEQHIKTFPVRRYILSKVGDGILYIRQSYMLDD